MLGIFKNIFNKVTTESIEPHVIDNTDTITLYQELRLQCINNIMLIESTLKAMAGNVNHAKGSSVSETKRKRKFLREQIHWYAVKLLGEEADLDHYTSLLKELQS
jgi:hypothetical protein